MMLNIPRSNTDIYYRYKMPAPRVKQESGNRTIIMNLKDMALALNICHQYILKFMGYELGCNVSNKEPILFGRYDEPKILKCLDKFIEHYILCSTCHYPEAILKIENKKDLAKECDACGTKTIIKNDHKVNAFILKNFERQIPLHARVIPNSEHLIDPTHTPHLLRVQSEDNHEEDESFEEEKKEVEVHVPFADIEAGLIDKAKGYYQQYETADGESLTTKEMIGNMKRDVPKTYWNKIPYLLFNGVFDINIAQNINKNGGLLKELYEELETPNPELDLLLNLQSFLFGKNDKTKFEKYVPTILKLFQDEDLLSDEFIIDWDDGKLKSKFMMDSRYQKQVDEDFKQAALPFIDWVKTTEESEEDEDNE